MTDKPTPDEIERVGAYWQRVRSLACEHPGVTITSFDGMTCSDCGRPLRMMSDVQIEELRGTSHDG